MWMDVSEESEAGKISAKSFLIKLQNRTRTRTRTRTHTHTHTHTHTRELAPSPKGPLAEPTIDVYQIPIPKILEVCFLNEISPFQEKQDVHS